MTVRYGVQIEFTVASILDGGPSRHHIREALREATKNLNRWSASGRFGSLSDVRIKYLHEATTPKKGRPAP